MASYVPPGAVVLAGIDLAGLRASPLYAKLPPAILGLTQPFQNAPSMLLASNGKDLLLVAGGKLTGPPDFVQAAEAQHRSGVTGVPDLLNHAQSIAAGQHIWLVVRGGTVLPLTGNAANVNRLLRDMEFAALTLRADSAIDVALTARGRTPEAARHFENTLRATLTMAAAGETRLAPTLRSIQLQREDRTVQAKVSLTPDAAQRLLTW
jgi:hypothetical protein